MLSGEINALSVFWHAKGETMKKLLVCLVLVVVAVLAIPVYNVFSGPPASPIPEISTTSDLDAQAHALIADKCAHCHAPGTALPFYAGLPGAAGMIQADVAQAQNFMNYEAMLALDPTLPPYEVMLAKTQFVVEQDSMPPGKYVMMHWNHALNEDDRATLLSWVAQERLQFAADKSLAPELAQLPVRPVPQPEALPEAKVALGRKLFHDVRLSTDNSLSCASCHGLDKGGTDQAPVSTGVGNQQGPINSPTVFNAVFALAQFWDGRAADLVEQADGPVNNPKEMGSNWDEVIPKLQQDTVLTEEFLKVYPDGYKKENFLDAIATFEKTLVTPNCAFDKFLQGDETALSDDEKEGFGLFSGYGCFTCHCGEAMGGNSFEKMGRHADYFADRGDPREVDAGRASVTKEVSDTGKFKVPTLRNVEITGPYFHDAAAQSLEAAVKTMAKYQLGRELPESEVAQLVKFLRTLTGEFEGKML